jgi:sulfite exporter TauE/SafE
MTVAFIIGLFSTLHCFGMCGGLVGAMTMSLDPDIRQRTSQLGLYTLSYNLGRISSYMVAGFLVGLFGQALKELLMPESGIAVLRLIASILIIAMGFYIAGWFPQFSKIEKIGTPLWKKLQPLGQRLLPVKSIWQAFLFGAVWGWLPCSLVYYILLISPAKDGAFNSAFFMLLFGLGTLTPMMAAGFLSGRLAPLRQSQKIRYFSGVVLIVMGLVSLLLATDPDAHQYLRFHVF